MRKTITIVTLTTAAVVWGSALFVLRGREAGADRLADRWVSEIVPVVTTAIEAEAAAVELHDTRTRLILARERLERARWADETVRRDMQRFRAFVDVEGGGQEDLRALAGERRSAEEDLERLQQEAGVLEARLQAISARDEVMLVAAYFRDVGHKVRSNSVDRRRLALRLGAEAQRWSGHENDGAAFLYLAVEPNADDIGQLRGEAILGAHTVAHDQEYGAPNSWLQMIGQNQADWESDR